MTKPLDPAFKALKAADRAMRKCPPQMWRANLEYLWDKYVTHARKTKHRAAKEPTP